jgi:uncharacterized membrane protein SirB2
MATVLYYLHVGCVVATAMGFIFRWILSLKASALLQQPLLRILPHVIDTFLLLSALGMVWIYGLNPFTTPWLLAKILALLGYILLGYMALKLRFSFVLRLVSGVLALGLLAYIVAVARTAQPTPWMIV